jgi:phenylacetate-CoA ligase
LTILTRDAMPILRYRTKDLVHKYKEKCPCGRTHKRISRIKGRSDDMMIVSGVNVFPSQIEQVIMKIPEVGNNYQIILNREFNLDKMHLKIELNSKYFTGQIKEINRLKDKILHDLRNEILISPKIELVGSGSLPPSMGKAKRIIDNREI